MGYREKFLELMKNGYSVDDAVENLYLNYSAYEGNDDIYKIKKEIAKAYNCDLNDIKLIGSAHTGFTLDNNDLADKSPSDFDFSIINAKLFSEYLLKKQRYYNDKDRNKHLLYGKIHPKYEHKDIKDQMDTINEQIRSKLKLNKKLSICFYISETAFIKGLAYFFSRYYLEINKAIANTKAIDNIQEITNITIKDVADLATLAKDEVYG